MKKIYFSPYWRTQGNEHLRWSLVKPECLLKKIPVAGHTECPSFRNLIKNFFVLCSPYDLHFRVSRSPENKPIFINLSSRLPSYIFQMRPEQQCKDGNKFLLSINIYALFLSNNPGIWIEQFPPFYHLTEGVDIIAGHFNIHNWQRPIDVGLLVDYEKEIKIKSGDPLCYLRFFDAVNASENFQIEQIQLTDEIMQMTESCLTFKDFKPNESFNFVLNNSKQVMFKPISLEL